MFYLSILIDFSLLQLSPHHQGHVAPVATILGTNLPAKRLRGLQELCQCQSSLAEGSGTGHPANSGDHADQCAMEGTQLWPIGTLD